ncbi:hypothetical protein DFS34DRAFT_109282 [Phlyctochytrium arcticum]|nr:hypothetical protein DFS34DRAFT_109282 [Phlyctochytrium arcticum]
MTGPTHAELVAKAQRLVQEKDEIESRITVYDQLLKSHNIGMTEQLTDSEGFPRADVDVWQVRNARVEIIKLQNDLKSIMGEIERAVHAVHAVHARARLEKESGVEISGGVIPSAAGQDSTALEPFASINGVAPDSPASEAGLARGDLVLKFGSVNGQTATKSEVLKLVSEVVNSNVDKSVEVLVRRNGSDINITVRPHTWSGRGLLGCHLVPA